MYNYTDGFPPDGAAVATINTYNTELVVVYYILAVCGIIICGVCFLFNFVYREKK